MSLIRSLAKTGRLMHNEVSETRRRRRTNDVMKDIDQRATYVVRKPRRKGWRTAEGGLIGYFPYAHFTCLFFPLWKLASVLARSQQPYVTSALYTRHIFINMQKNRTALFFSFQQHGVRT